jgi:hypothetical protein
LLPTANIVRSDKPTVLPLAPRYLGEIAFESLRGESITVTDALRSLALFRYSTIVPGSGPAAAPIARNACKLGIRR